MALRCFLFSSDAKDTWPLGQVLAGLGVEIEPWEEAAEAVEKITCQSFQIVILDWDKQPEASQLLTVARKRKASERPLVLAMVSSGAEVAKALQAGANSILRKPIVVSEARDTLTTARDLLRARQDAPAAAAAAPASAVSASLKPEGEKTLRAGEFLQSSGPAPGAEFVVDSDVQTSAGQPTTDELSPLNELEPVAAALQQVEEEKKHAEPPPATPAAGDEPRGLSWYLNRRATAASPAPSPAAAAPAPAPAQPELIGYDEPALHSAASPATEAEPEAPAAELAPAAGSEQEATEQLFAYIEGDREHSGDETRPRSKAVKKIAVGALVLAACATVAAPQAPWHPKVRAAWARGQQTLHAWLNPQPVTTPQAPVSHEDFGRPGDEYKLPVAESIPDATTDPSQIRVTPVVDPTARKANDAGANEEQTLPGDGTGTNPGDTSAPAIRVQENPSAQPSTEAAGGTTSAGAAAAAAAAEHLRSDAAATSSSPVSSVAPGLAQPAPPGPLPHSVSNPAPTTGIPSSLKSQMASMAPDASGNKPPEAALPSIEPVDIPEAAARELLSEQQAIAYPANAKGQQGTVVLQVLIGRDGTVQDAKFLQGSLAFARAAIDGVKQWKFKPYMMNGRAVSVETPLTISFAPGP